ncbi:DUF397 domain-containing protein [Actinoplanes sp. N902-109]|uniref:DUF397 domain-containing protein n=1 Tax=Actinoplanes sp. (strain N902-109) TaxID=649831 RepID=UPI00039B5954|nr:DUF397 domain-containing protein [Actinoplanes sp. N902-109]
MTLMWRKSSRSGQTACVEIAVDTDAVLMRDSKDPSGPVLTFDRRAFQDFLTYVKEKAADPGRRP